MGKISSYPKITELTSDHLLLVDGSSGTKTIKAGDLAASLESISGSIIKKDKILTEPALISAGGRNVIIPKKFTKGTTVGQVVIGYATVEIAGFLSAPINGIYNAPNMFFYDIFRANVSNTKNTSGGLPFGNNFKHGIHLTGVDYTSNSTFKDVHIRFDSYISTSSYFDPTDNDIVINIKPWYYNSTNDSVLPADDISLYLTDLNILY